MVVYHPGARRSRGGPSRYGDYPIDTETGAIDCPPDVEEDVAAALAGKYDLEADDLLEAEDVEPDEAGDGETCQTIKSDGEVCGRDLPCQYHSDDEAEDDDTGEEE